MPQFHEKHRRRARRLLCGVAIGVLGIACTEVSTGAAPDPDRTVVPYDLALPAPRVPAVPPERVVRIPDRIDATGGEDVTTPIQRFLDRQPDMSTIVFPEGAVYRIDDGLDLDGRSGLYFEGNGATLIARGCEHSDSPFWLNDSDTITITDLVLRGDNPHAATPEAYQPGCEYQSGININQSRDIEIDSVEVEGTRGDCFFVDGATPEYVWSEGVWIHDSMCSANGRMGVAITAGRDVFVERTRFDDLAFFALDIEPYLAEGGAIGVTFIDNVIGTYGVSSVLENYFFAANGHIGSEIRDVTVAHNTVENGTLRTLVSGSVRADITFVNNRAHVPMRGPSLVFKGVDGLIVAGNHQPLTSGILFHISDSTDVVLE